MNSIIDYKFYFLYLMVALNYPSIGQTLDVFTDTRDGKSYKTVSYEIKGVNGSIKTMTWMAENLDYGSEGSYYREGSIIKNEHFGRLYTWPTAKISCPQGWYLPTDKDWTALVNLFGGLDSAGQHLKSKSLMWNNGGKGSNKSLFNALPYGTGDGKNTYPNFGRSAIFWSASEKDADYAWDWILGSGWKKILRSDGHKLKTANSVRCIRDND